MMRPRRKAAGTLFAALALLTCTPPLVMPPAVPLPPTPLAVSDEAWVRSTLELMTLEQRVGQMLMLRLSGAYENVRAPAMREVERYIAYGNVGGFVVSAGSPAELALKLNELQGRSPLPLLFAAEYEWGAATWPALLEEAPGPETGGTVFPTNMGIAATGDPLLAELAGRITAAESRAIGIHWLLAPVTDLSTVPDNPVINVRSYGNDPVSVGRYAAAFVRGATNGGALTTARHFPGQGDTRVDPNIGLPVINVDGAALQDRELEPFRAVLRAGVPAVMLGHVAVPALTDGVPIPASIAPQIATGLLRHQMGFDGLIVTDALHMGALREVAGYSPGEIAVRAVQAGADILLAPPDPLLAHRALVAAVRSGRIHYSRVDSSVVRILRAKARLGLHRVRTVPLDSVQRVVGAPEHAIVAADIAARSLTLARDSAAYLPIDPRRMHEINLVVFSTPGDMTAGAALADEMRRIYGSEARVIRLDEWTAESAYDTAFARARMADATVLATFLMPRAGVGHLVAPERLRRLAARLKEESPRMVVVSFGDPFGPAVLPGASSYLLAWQPRGEAAQRATARAIAGRIPIPGKLPVQLPRSTVGRGIDRPAIRYGLEFSVPEEVGMDPDLLARVDSIISAGITNGAAPGVVIAVGRHGRLVRLRGYGTLDRRRGFGPVTDSTIYDLASVTKVAATTMAVMMLVDRGLLRLDDRVSHHLPEWKGSPAKQRVTLRNLLLHNAGLPAYAPFWRELRGRDAYRRRITAMSLEYEPGTRTVYSDFGMILLGFIIEQVSGQPLDVFLRENLYGPLGMRDTGFNPLEWPYGMLQIDGDIEQRGAVPDPLIARIAPTEMDTIFRMRHIRGQVHDENAFALGGVAGHAGLFSSARDLAILAQLLLDRGWYGGIRYIDPSTVALFTRRVDIASNRGLGWETAWEPGSSAGTWFSRSSFGHTGFTGPSIWIDPERDLFLVILMNRVNPTRDNQRHVPLRRAIADAVQLAITDWSVPGVRND